MNSSQGTFVVIEGIDEVLVDEQINLLAKKLKYEGHNILILNQDKQNAKSPYIQKLQNGDYDDVPDINPYIATLMYSLHRFDGKQEIEKALDEGFVVLSNGYTSRQFVEQSKRLKTAEERRGFFLWVDTIEYQLMQLPRPSTNLVLLTHASKKDKHKKAVLDIYRDVGRLFPKDFQLVDCVRNRKTMQSGHIQKLLYEQVQSLIKPTQNNTKGTITKQMDRPVSPKEYIDTPTTDRVDAVQLSYLAHIEVLKNDLIATALPYYNEISFYIPKNLPIKIKKQYEDFINNSSRVYRKLKTSLKEFETIAKKQLSDYEIEEISCTILPAATLSPFTIDSNNISTISSNLIELQESGSLHLDNSFAKESERKISHASYSIDYTDLKLTTASPRNELDVTHRILYEQSDLSTSELLESFARWSYDEKINKLLGNITSPKCLAHIEYNWDLTLPLKQLLELPYFFKNSSWLFQKPTPRFGYEIPAIVEEVGLADEVEACFDISLKIHNELLGSSMEYEADYCVLLGHKNRVRLTSTAKDLLDACQDQSLPMNMRILVGRLINTIQDIHPIVYQEVFEKLLIEHSKQASSGLLT